MKRIRIAQIGTSDYSHGSDIWNTLTKYKDLFEVVGYALPENEREKFPHRMNAFEGYKEMTVEEILSDPTIEAVTVETEEIYLTKYALMVARAGKHLHMEKPGGKSLSDFETLISLLKEKNLAFSVGYMYRFNPIISDAVEKALRGDLGKIFSVEAQMNCKHPPEMREWLKTFPGGMLFFLGCHLIDLIYRIQGEPKKVLPLSTSTNIDGISSDDFGMVVYQYENGVSFAKTCDNERGGFSRRQLVISGEKGTIEIRPLETYCDGVLYTVGGECTSEEWLAEAEMKRSAPFDRYQAMMRHFAEVVRGKENIYGYDYELGLYKLILRSCGKELI